jgi:hypothetical protein
VDHGHGGEWRGSERRSGGKEGSREDKTRLEKGGDEENEFIDDQSPIHHHNYPTQPNTLHPLTIPHHPHHQASLRSQADKEAAALARQRLEDKRTEHDDLVSAYR